MKTKFWILLLAFLLIGCLGAGFLLLRPGTPAQKAQVHSDGKLIKTVDLTQEQQFTVTCKDGFNIITIRDGKIAVTSADCPDGYCVARGFCNSGPQIVCLPHRLTITFLGDTEVDSMVG